MARLEQDEAHEDQNQVYDQSFLNLLNEVIPSGLNESSEDENSSILMGFPDDEAQADSDALRFAELQHDIDERSSWQRDRRNFSELHLNRKPASRQGNSHNRTITWERNLHQSARFCQVEEIKLLPLTHQMLLFIIQFFGLFQRYFTVIFLLFDVNNGLDSFYFFVASMSTLSIVPKVQNNHK